MPTTNLSPNYKQFIEMAKTGHYPLFFDEWVKTSMTPGQMVSLSMANQKVQTVFTALERHRRIEKKKTALITMDKISREDFIRSYFKVVEHQVLKEDLKLQ